MGCPANDNVKSSLAIATNYVLMKKVLNTDVTSAQIVYGKLDMHYRTKLCMQ